MIRVVHSPLKWWAAVAAMASLRLAHVNLLWSDEDYHLAAAIQLLHRRVPYRDFWYDKPPLAALFYTLIGGHAGWPLRLLDLAFVLACCSVVYQLARARWGESEGRAAALLLAFFTTFYLPAATIPLAVDALMLLPHLAAIYFAQQRRAFWSGICCALGLLTNVKAVFVAATCALWLFNEIPMFAAGLGVPLIAALSLGGALGALPGFYKQVWLWGLRYAGASASPHSIEAGLTHCLHWFGFHGALLAGAVLMIREQTRSERWSFGIWFGLSAAALVFGNHFAPRYFLQLLPVMVVAGGRGMVVGIARYKLAGIALFVFLLLIPTARFGPRYIGLIRDNVAGRQTHWSDAAMDVDSQQVALTINCLKHPGDTLFVWGYRPDDYVYTRLVPPGRFWDSQPLDGVPADRHLSSNRQVLDQEAKENRAEMIQSQPTFVVDGLGLLNPWLSPDRFPEMAAWLRHYELVRQTKFSRIYRRMR